MGTVTWPCGVLSRQPTEPLSAEPTSSRRWAARRRSPILDVAAVAILSRPVPASWPVSLAGATRPVVRFPEAERSGPKPLSSPTVITWSGSQTSATGRWGPLGAAGRGCRAGPPGGPPRTGPSGGIPPHRSSAGCPGASSAASFRAVMPKPWSAISISAPPLLSRRASIVTGVSAAENVVAFSTSSAARCTTSLAASRRSDPGLHVHHDPLVLLDLRDRRAHHVYQRHRLAPPLGDLVAGENQQVLRVATHPGSQVV